MNDFLNVFLIGMTIVMSLLVFFAFFRAVKGPSVADRIVSVNMIGTQVIIIIALLTVIMNENWLADVAGVYAMISFLAVVVLTKVYIGVYRERQDKKNGDH